MRLIRSARLLLLALLISVVPASSFAGIFISVGFAPPVLPVYVQPVCPSPDLMWMPGYWHYGPDGYFWVPGAWVPAPYSGALWTPGYWGFRGGQYIFNEGYWGAHIGFYGGVNYGFGYGGIGFAGGEWRGGHFAYNTAVINVNVNVIHSTYVDHTVVERGTVAGAGHTAYSGGPGGVKHDPTPEEKTAMNEKHTPPTKFQQQHVETAKADKTAYAKNNGGHPTHTAAEKPLAEEKHAPPAASKTPAKTEAKTPSKGTVNPNPKTEAKTPPKTEPKAGPKTEPKTEPKAGPKTEPKAGPKTEPKPATQPKPAPQNHPAAAPKSQPKSSKPKGR
jgi:hypothetical protein